jgi:hypothetical protein
MKHKWLIAKNGHLGCSDCSQVGHLGLYETQGLSLSSEWTNCTITFNDTEIKQQLKSLRTEIWAHQASLAHNKAGLILAEAQKHN